MAVRTLYPTRCESISPDEDDQGSEGRELWLRETRGFRKGRGWEVWTSDGGGRMCGWRRLPDHSRDGRKPRVSV